VAESGRRYAVRDGADRSTLETVRGEQDAPLPRKLIDIRTLHLIFEEIQRPKAVSWKDTRLRRRKFPATQIKFHDRSL